MFNLGLFDFSLPCAFSDSPFSYSTLGYCRSVLLPFTFQLLAVQLFYLWLFAIKFRRSVTYRSVSRSSVAQSWKLLQFQQILCMAVKMLA